MLFSTFCATRLLSVFPGTPISFQVSVGAHHSLKASLSSTGVLTLFHAATCEMRTFSPSTESPSALRWKIRRGPQGTPSIGKPELELSSLTPLRPNQAMERTADRCTLHF